MEAGNDIHSTKPRSGSCGDPSLRVRAREHGRQPGAGTRGQLLPLNLPLGFTIDRVVVAPGVAPGGEALAAGTVNVFQKIFFRRLTLVNASTGAVLFKETTPAPRLSTLVPPLAVETAALMALTSPISNPLTLGLATVLFAAESSPSVPLDNLISQGARLFFEEKFAGNGRTCGTCHPASNNLTIDPAFIATLPPTDPLFVAELNPALAQLERPLLMRQFGLILENLDGLDDPTNKFVMRGVPHTLGLPVSLERDTGLVPPAPAEMTGWSGDGAPGSGSLREFAIGAVTQHFTKNLARVEGHDFNLPSAHQLDAMEAFQLSLGRSADFDLSKITFLNADLNTGKDLFINGGGNPAFTGTCNFCHTNAGALSVVLGNQNRNFKTNVEDVLHPARTVEPFPFDGGFGQTPSNPDGSFGNRTFNTASVVEAADTAPFFHNNVKSTLDEAVTFYSEAEFNADAVAKFNFDPTQNQNIADFLRGVNTLQNIDVAQRELQAILALTGNPQQEVQTRLQTALDDTHDAIDVLTAGGLFPAAVTHLTDASSLIVQAQSTGNPNQLQAFVQGAIAKLGEARDAVATIAP